jgi:hypothetical protein
MQLWAALILSDQKEACWPGYERQVGKWTGKLDEYLFTWKHVPELPEGAVERIALYNSPRLGEGRCIGTSMTSNQSPAMKAGNTITATQRIYIQSVSLYSEEALK